MTVQTVTTKQQTYKAMKHEYSTYDKSYIKHNNDLDLESYVADDTGARVWPQPGPAQVALHFGTFRGAPSSRRTQVDVAIT